MTGGQTYVQACTYVCECDVIKHKVLTQIQADMLHVRVCVCECDVIKHKVLTDIQEDMLHVCVCVNVMLLNTKF